MQHQRKELLGGVAEKSAALFVSFVMKSMQNFKKMQKNARKICIYQIKAVPLHRQNQNTRADNRQSAAFILSVGVS